MFIIYDIVFFIIALIHLPFYILRGKYRHGLAARAGIAPGAAIQPGCIWIHAVSVGEVMTIKPLVTRIKEIFPNRLLVVSTVTATGNKVARQQLGGKARVTYLPFDLSFIVRSVMGRARPALFIAAETELWPNLFSTLAKMKAPVVVVNARISDRSLRGYSALKFLLKPLLEKIAFFCAQTQTDKDRLAILGAPQDNIAVTGNMKFDSAVFSIDAAELIRCRRALSLEDRDKLLVAGSTHPGEEEMLLDVYKKLLREFPVLKLLIAPRHPDRASEIGKIAAKYGFTPLRISVLCQRPTTNDQRPVFILDTVGDLINYYAISDVVFMGGSLVKKGGHNFLEPGLLEKPILTGPHMFNFRDLTEQFSRNKALTIVGDARELEAGLKRVLSDPQGGAKQARSARALILESQGAVERTVQYLKPYLSGQMQGQRTVLSLQG